MNIAPQRRRHFCLKDRELELPQSERPTIPGVMSERSCVYYGARWSLAPIKDMLHLVHSPVGCAYYGRTIRSLEYPVYTTDLQEQDVIFGTGQKLERAIREALQLNPRARGVFVYSTCVAGLLGEDLENLCGRLSRETGRLVLVVNCPGYCGFSQGAGHDVAARLINQKIIGRDQGSGLTADLNLLGEFDVRGDFQEVKALLGQLGLIINCAFNGDVDVERLQKAHRVKLNLLHCRKTGRLLAESMARRFGVPWLKVSFFGLTELSASLLRLGDALGIKRQAEDVIKQELAREEHRWLNLLPLLEGKKVLLFFGGSRLSTMVSAFQDLGLNVVVAGSQFGCQADYQDSWERVESGALLADDLNDRELEELIEDLQPDLIVGGTKERYVCHKLGKPFLVFPQEARPYAGYRGFGNLAGDLASQLKAPVWSLVKS